MDFFDMEFILLEYLNRASSNTYVQLFEYLNAIKMEQFKGAPTAKMDLLKWMANQEDDGSYVIPFSVTETENDEINIGLKITWTYIIDYIKNLADYGSEDDIICAYDWVMENCK